MVQESTKLQKKGLDTGVDLALLRKSKVEVIKEKQIKSEGPKNHPLTGLYPFCAIVRTQTAREKNFFLPELLYFIFPTKKKNIRIDTSNK